MTWQVPIYLDIEAEIGKAEIFTHDEGPVKSRDFRADGVAPIQVPECTWNMIEAIETVHSKRGECI